MTNEQLLEKLSRDMKMRNFSPYTYDTYMRKTKEMDLCQVFGDRIV